MGDKSKRILADREVQRRFEEDKRAAEERARMLAVRCRSCRRAKQPVYVEMGGFVFCGDCIEAAAQIVAENKADAENAKKGRETR